jgi:regulator of replication initiation timing
LSGNLRKKDHPTNGDIDRVVISQSTEESISKLASAIICVGEAIDSQQAQITKLVQENEAILMLLARLNDRLGAIDEENRRVAEWESEGGR